MYGIICVITAEPKRPDTPERKSAIVIVPLTIAAAIDLNYELRDFLLAYKRKEEYDNSQKKSYCKEYQCAEQRAVYR